MKQGWWLFLLIALLVLPSQGNGDEEVTGLPIHSARDALGLLQRDAFGPISLQRLRGDIDQGVIYSFSRKYGACAVEVESQNSPKRYGGVGFSFYGAKARLDLSSEDVKGHFRKLGIEPGASIHGGQSYHWMAEGFSCSLDYDDELGLLEYLCHYVKTQEKGGLN
ncbi:hypothetical protein DSLASN_11210 [Desulfoluna limicola]|uniref:Uncharacterized protein n=1 Tax=Desulfoluna limicola TaxID=2810562 RepID=A0ABN6F0K6_9BACT|nr:hypothetical protein [Desulfoluna limicola]BCS95489.1 hypothetical protein DSLASN_11210 [Desulfoluna limicola]